MITFNNIPDQIYSAFYNKANGDDKVTINFLNRLLRDFDNIVKNKQKWPVSDKLYEETGIRTFGDIHKKYDIFEEHIIPVDLRLRTGIFKIKQNYSKEELYEWFYDTLNLVYKLQSEHDESTNGGKLAEMLLPEELHRKDKWEKLN
jgi:hypothetical protein